MVNILVAQICKKFNLIGWNLPRNLHHHIENGCCSFFWNFTFFEWKKYVNPTRKLPFYPMYVFLVSQKYKECKRKETKVRWIQLVSIFFFFFFLYSIKQQLFQQVKRIPCIRILRSAKSVLVFQCRNHSKIFNEYLIIATSI